MGFQVRVNGESVWESEEDHSAIDRVSLVTARGEAGAIGSAPDNEYVDVRINIRNAELTSDLDLLEAEKFQGRRERLEDAEGVNITGAGDTMRGTPTDNPVMPPPPEETEEEQTEGEQEEEGSLNDLLVDEDIEPVTASKRSRK